MNNVDILLQNAKNKLNNVISGSATLDYKTISDDELLQMVQECDNKAIAEAVERNSKHDNKFFNQLVKNKNGKIRATVATLGLGLEILVNDEDAYVRRMVARHGYGLETLVNDEHARVRAEVAKQGYGLETLVNDSDWGVRAAVAGQGYGLETLVNDENVSVCESALFEMKKLK